MAIPGIVARAVVCVCTLVLMTIDSTRLTAFSNVDASYSPENLLVELDLGQAGQLVLRSSANMGGTVEVRNCSAPASRDAAANRGYMDDCLQALPVKEPVVAAAVYPVALEALVVGMLIDGHVLSLEDRVLLVGQTDPSENGLWCVRASDTGGGAMRCPDLPAGAPCRGLLILVQFGITWGFHCFVCCPTPGTVVGCHPLRFVPLANQLPSSVGREPGTDGRDDVPGPFLRSACRWWGPSFASITPWCPICRPAARSSRVVCTWPARCPPRHRTRRP